MSSVSKYLSRLIVLIGIGVGSAQAANLVVATNGVDTDNCGGASAPCQTINTAIDNARAGDVIQVKPGSYNLATEGAGCGNSCMILVNKRLRIESTKGRGATRLEGEGVTDVVRITADDVTFGQRRKGFTITGASGHGLFIGGVSGVRVIGNLAVGNSGDGFGIEGNEAMLQYNHAVGNGDDGFDLNAEECVLDWNEATDNAENGFFVRADDNELTHNVATANGADGFRIKDDKGNVLDQNAAVDNGSSGFEVLGDFNTVTRGTASGNFEHGIVIEDGPGNVVTYNAVLGNGDNGINTSVDDAEIHHNNIHGNTGSGGNCGLRNSSGVAIVAPLNFFGVAAGPGADPADTTCGDTVTTVPNASSEWSQPYSWLSGI